MKVEVAVLGFPSLIIRTVSVDVMQHFKKKKSFTVDPRSCVKVEVDVLGSPSLIIRTVSVDAKQHYNNNNNNNKRSLSFQSSGAV